MELVMSNDEFLLVKQSVLETKSILEAFGAFNPKLDSVLKKLRQVVDGDSASISIENIEAVCLKNNLYERFGALDKNDEKRVVARGVSEKLRRLISK